MRIYEERSQNKRTVNCPCCGKEGHMWSTCPLPAQFAKLEKEGKEPDLTLMGGWLQRRWDTLNDDGTLMYANRLFKNAERYGRQQQLRVENREAKKARQDAYEKSLGITKAKRKTSCGFCGGTDHNRRNCDIMFNFVDDLTRASTNYRKKFYERLVQGQGFAEGALVGVSASYMNIGGKWIEDFEGIGIVSKIAWDKVNLGLTMSNWEYCSKLRVEMLVSGNTMAIDNPFRGMIEADISDDGKRGKIAELFSGSHGYGVQIDSIVAPSENIPSEEWFNEGYTDCWEWITKKKALADVTHYLTPLIAKWHPSRLGRNAGKLNFRLSQYGYTRRK